jgi:hypothetical protein
MRGYPGTSGADQLHPAQQRRGLGDHRHHRLQGRYKRATDSYEQILYIAREIGDRSCQSEAHEDVARADAQQHREPYRGPAAARTRPDQDDRHRQGATTIAPAGRMPHRGSQGFDAVEVWNGLWTSDRPWNAGNEAALAEWGRPGLEPPQCSKIICEVTAIKRQHPGATRKVCPNSSRSDAG